MQDYVSWILQSAQAAAIARRLQWAEMPVKIMLRAADILHNMTCTTRSPPARAPSLGPHSHAAGPATARI